MAGPLQNKPVADALEMIRYYTELDPYYYAVDNRPIKDLDSNDGLLAKAIDASMQVGMASATMLGHILDILHFSCDHTQISDITYTGQLSIIFNRSFGVYERIASSSDFRLIPRLAATLEPVTLNFDAPSAPENSIAYLVQAIPVAMDAANGAFPLYDTTNPFLPTNSPVGIIKFSVKKGMESVTGAEQPPEADTDFTPVCVVRVKGTQSQITESDITYLKGTNLGRVDHCKYREIDGDYTVVHNDETIISKIGTSSTVTLMSHAPLGKPMIFKNHYLSTGTLSIVVAGGGSIDGSSKVDLTPGQSTKLLSDGVTWFVI